MNINSAFPSDYLKAADLNGQVARVMIKNVTMGTVGNDSKPIMYFQGKEKGLVLNKTNATTIAYAYGTDTDQWAGAEIELFMALVDYQGRQVEAIRVRVPPRRAQQPAQQRPATYDNGFDDENPAPRARPPAAAAAGGLPEDPIPFAAEWRG